MSRETYQPPALASGSGGAGSSGFASSSGNQQSSIFAQAQNFDESTRPVQYLCGECDNKVVLKKGDAIRCKECGYRVLYKERTNRMIQFEAR